MAQGCLPVSHVYLTHSRKIPTFAMVRGSGFFIYREGGGECLGYQVSSVLNSIFLVKQYGLGDEEPFQGYCFSSAISPRGINVKRARKYSPLPDVLNDSRMTLVSNSQVLPSEGTWITKFLV